MPNSQRYKQLYQSVKKLESILPQYKASGNYTLEEQTKIKAYRLLSHAEIESYLEDIAKKKAETAFNKWLADKTKSNILLNLSLFSSIQPSKNDKKSEIRLRKIYNDYKNIVEKNNGIKEGSVEKIFLPLGIETSTIDSILLSDLSSFGEDRGVIAHSSIRTHNILDPNNEKNKVNGILTNLTSLDEMVKNLR